VKLNIIILLFSFYVSICNAQSYEKEWAILIRKVEAGNSQGLEDFALKFKNEHSKYPDYSAQLYSGIALNYYNSNKIQKAEENYLKAYAYSKAATDTSLKHICEYYLAIFYHEQNNLLEAEKYYLACMAGMASVYGQSSREYTQIFFNYTTLLVSLEKHTHAKPYIEALLYYYKTLDGEKSKSYLLLLSYQAIVYQNLAEYDKAIDILSRLHIEKQIIASGDTLSQVIVLSNLGDVYRETGNYDLAIAHLKKAKQEYFNYKLRDRSLLATLENNLALCYKAIGNIQESEESYNRTLATYREIGEQGTEAYCTTLSNKADLYRELGRLGEASALLITALEIRKERYGNNTENYANALSNLANVYFDAGYYQLSLEKNLEANSIYKKVVAENHQGYGNSFNNLSLCYYQLKDYVQARECKEKALRVIENGVGKNYYRYASYLISGCGIYRKTKEYGKLEAHLTEALFLAEKNFGKKHDLYARAQMGLAELYTIQGKFESATPFYFEALDYYSQQLNSFFDAMSEENQISYFNSIDPVFASYSSFLLNYRIAKPHANLSEHIRRSFRYQLLLKSLLTSKSTRTTREILSSDNNELKDLYKNWLIVKNELINNYKSTQPSFENNDLVKKASELETALKSMLKDFGTNAPANLVDITSSLKNREAAVEIFRVTSWNDDTIPNIIYAAYVVKKNSKDPELIIFPNGNEMEKSAFEFYADCIENQKRDGVSYNMFFLPLEKSLTGVQRIYVSADGVFHKINLAGLMLPGKLGFIEDEKELVMISNVSILTQSAAKSNPNLSASLFGYPDYDYDFKKEKSILGLGGPAVAKRFRLNNLAKLPGTKKEVEEISKSLMELGWKSQVLMEQHASEATLRKIDSPKILHIATHGFYLSDIETDDKTFLGFNSYTFKENSMLRSGIILAGAIPATSDSTYTESENDGIVTAYEASMLNLVNTDLVVLSACQTGLGDYVGSQGVLGLQRAFAIAGAKNLILSLWPVDDDATKTLMISFYKNYAVTKNIESSFRLSKELVKKQFPHPFFWSAFVLLKTVQ
jgi:CHAT domain-containing protein